MSEPDAAGRIVRVGKIVGQRPSASFVAVAIMAEATCGFKGHSLAHTFLGMHFFGIVRRGLRNGSGYTVLRHISDNNSTTTRKTVPSFLFAPLCYLVPLRSLEACCVATWWQC